MLCTLVNFGERIEVQYTMYKHNMIEKQLNTTQTEIYENYLINFMYTKETIRNGILINENIKCT